jgi:hypothetical protein
VEGRTTMQVGKDIYNLPPLVWPTDLLHRIVVRKRNSWAWPRFQRSRILKTGPENWPLEKSPSQDFWTLRFEDWNWHFLRPLVFHGLPESCLPGQELTWGNPSCFCHQSCSSHHFRCKRRAGKGRPRDLVSIEVRPRNVGGLRQVGRTFEQAEVKGNSVSAPPCDGLS